MTPSQQDTSIAQRIERLPLGRFHRRFIALVSLGMFFDLFDVFMAAFIGAAMQQSGFLTLRQFSWFVAAGFLGMFFGTIFLGMGSDRVGRRSAFVTLLAVYSAFTLAGAFAPSAAWLIALRFCAGVGIGAEIVVVDTYVTEIVPARVRGRYVAITQIVGFCAVPVAAILSRLLVPTHLGMAGWRWVMVAGGLGAVFTWWFRRKLPESPRWLESRGRHAEAMAVMAALEAESYTAAAGKDVAGREVSPAKEAEAERASFAELWNPAYRGRTAMLMVFQLLQTIGVYGFANWAPTFLLKRGVSLVHSLDYTMLIALVSPVGPAIAAATADRLERKWTIVTLAMLIAGFGLGFGFWHAPAGIVLCGALVTLFNYWFSAAFHAYQSELFPTRIRATGVGFTYSWSRMSGALSSLLIGAMLVYGAGAVFVLLAAAMAGVAAVVAAMGPETGRRTLEEISR